MASSVPTIPGTKADRALADSFRYEISGLIGRQQTTFPGAQPVSFAHQHMDELLKEDYYVCEKTDGIRCLMYLTEDNGQEVVYMIDRKNDYYHVPNLHFPLDAENPEPFHKATLLDGELVEDQEPDGSLKMKYLVFDCMVMDGKNLMNRTHDKRLAYFKQLILAPYKILFQKFPQELEFVPFTIHFKDQEFSYAIPKMFNDIIPKLKHGSDGLIFTCRNSGYTPGTDQKILKWKMESENSIDFRMHLHFPVVEPDSDYEDGAYPDYTALPRISLTVFGGSTGDRYFADMELTASEWERMKALNQPLDDRIVECCRDAVGKWRFSRFRDDKSESNHISTANSVIDSMTNAVTKETLLRRSDEIRTAWKKRAAAQEQPSGPRATNGDAVTGNGGIKRKFEGSDQAAEG